MVVGDLFILTRLTTFDHWETGRSPAKDESAIGKYEQHLYRHTGKMTHLSWGEPFPNLIALVDLAKFRLLHGLRTNDVLHAPTEVGHLARLVYSDETLINTVLAIGILRAERRAYVAAVERDQLDPADWVAVSEDDLNRMHRVAVSMGFVMLGGAEETQWRRIAKLPVEPFGLCGSIHESMTLWMSQPDISRWPGELFPQLDLGFIRQALASSSCSTPLARHAYRRSGWNGLCGLTLSSARTWAASGCTTPRPKTTGTVRDRENSGKANGPGLSVLSLALPGDEQTGNQNMHIKQHRPQRTGHCGHQDDQYAGE